MIRPATRCSLLSFIGNAGAWVWLALWPAAPPAAAQPPQVNIEVKTQGKQVWPALNENQVYWHEPAVIRSTAELDAVWLAVSGERPVLYHPKYSNTLFTVKKIKRQVKSKIAGVTLDTDWRSFDGKHKGSKSLFVPFDLMTDYSIWYVPARPAGGRWNVDLVADVTWGFYLSSESLARRFTDAVLSARQSSAKPLTRKVAGVYLKDLTAEQAADAGRSRIEGALVTLVAIGSPADVAGLQALDIVLEFNGKPATNEDLFSRQLLSAPSNTPIPVTVLRKIVAPDGTKPSYTWERKSLTITLR